MEEIVLLMCLHVTLVEISIVVKEVELLIVAMVKTLVEELQAAIVK